MSASGDLAGRNRVSIRSAEPADYPGVRTLLTQMPRWEDATHGAFRDENIVAIDDQGQIVGWLAGNHVSEAWRNIPGYDMAEEWRCSYIAWVLVDEGCRSAGVGAMLMEAFARDSAVAGRDTIVASPPIGRARAGAPAVLLPNGLPPRGIRAGSPGAVGIPGRCSPTGA